VTHDRRYAIYFVPADDSPLGVFGARLFGRWPDGTPEPDTLAVPEREERTRRVARYGFHATLKAPFALASGCTESGLVDAAAQLLWMPRRGRDANRTNSASPNAAYWRPMDIRGFLNRFSFT